MFGCSWSKSAVNFDTYVTLKNGLTLQTLSRHIKLVKNQSHRSRAYLVKKYNKWLLIIVLCIHLVGPLVILFGSCLWDRYLFIPCLLATHAVPAALGRLGPGHVAAGNGLERPAAPLLGQMVAYTDAFNKSFTCWFALKLLVASWRDVPSSRSMVDNTAES